MPTSSSFSLLHLSGGALRALSAASAARSALLRSPAATVAPPSRSFHAAPRNLSFATHTLRASVAPIAPSYDAPLPDLPDVDHIDPSELEVHESTLRRLSALSAKHGRPVHLRVLVDQGGCSGLEYKFETEMEGKPEEEDIVLDFGPHQVFVDRGSWLWLRGSRIEFQEELARSAFVVSDNPNATQACGCKSSFAPKQ